MERLYLGNLLTGCVPAGLRDVPRHCEPRSAVLQLRAEGPSPSRPTLISDCEALLAAQDTLAELVGGQHGVDGRDGRPPELGGLSNLTTLYLYDNQLTGEILWGNLS